MYLPRYVGLTAVLQAETRNLTRVAVSQAILVIEAIGTTNMTVTNRLGFSVWPMCCLVYSSLMASCIGCGRELQPGGYPDNICPECRAAATVRAYQQARANRRLIYK